MLRDKRKEMPVLELDILIALNLQIDKLLRELESPWRTTMTEQLGYSTALANVCAAKASFVNSLPGTPDFWTARIEYVEDEEE